MDMISISRTVTLVSAVTGVVAGTLICVGVLRAKATLFSGRWFLLLFGGALFTMISYIVAIVAVNEAVNWNKPDHLRLVSDDPGPLERGFPFAALVLGSLLGGSFVSRRAKRSPNARP